VFFFLFILIIGKLLRRVYTVDIRSAIMGSRIKVAACIVVTGGAHAGETGFVLEKRKKRCIYYSEQLRQLSWCSIRNVRVVHRFEVRVAHPASPTAYAVDIGCQPYLHGNNLFLW
jgi:hypothetical protein